MDYGSVSDYASNSVSASASFDYGDVSDYVSNSLSSAASYGDVSDYSSIWSGKNKDPIQEYNSPSSYASDISAASNSYNYWSVSDEEMTDEPAEDYEVEDDEDEEVEEDDEEEEEFDEEEFEEDNDEFEEDNDA